MGECRLVRRALAFACLGLSLCASAANPVEVDRGLAWLSGQVQADGTVAGEAGSIATAFQARAETLATLKQLSTVPAPLANTVSQEPDSASEYLARRVAAMASLGADVSAPLALLLTWQNADGGFGAAPAYQGNALDTAHALLALKAANGSATAVGRALAALSSMQAADGSFGINGQGSVYVTAQALQALNAFAQTYALVTAIQGARNWLVGAQSAGAYSSVLDNAAAGLALAGATLDASTFSGAQNALKSSQAANGSWANDPYLTALALRALLATASAPPPATTGQVSGVVVDQVSSAPLGGVQVVLSGAQAATVTTDASGAFSAVGLTPGSYTVALSKAGYSTVSLTITVSAGVVSNLGTIRLQVATTTASLQGTVRDGTNGQAIGGATVSVSGGPATTTDAAGNYQLAGLIPGAATITVSMSGFQAVTVSATLSAGVVISFSPSLYAPGQGPTDATLAGKVVDRATGQGISGATVKVGTATSTTGSGGTFTLAGLAAGGVSIEVSAAGYVSATFTATLASGVNDVGSIAIDRPAASAKISGRVSDSATSLPIGGATVKVVGSTLQATTNSNGNYEIAGVTQTQFSLSVAAAGYQSKNVAVTLPALADSTVNATLEPVPPSSVILRRVATALPSYEPFRSIEIEVDVQNTAATPAQLVFTATVIDPLGAPIHEIPGTLVTIPASAQVEVELETHLGADPAGTYSVLVRGFSLDGFLVAEGSASFQVLAVTRLGGGITLNPPILQAGTNQPVSIGANLSNNGNQPIAAGSLELQIVLTHPEDIAAKATLDLLPGGLIGAPLNNPAGASFDAQGNFYTVNLQDLRVLRIAPDGQTTVVKTLPNILTLPFLSVNPVDSRVDASGNVYVLNAASEILKIAPDGTLTRIPTGLVGTQLAFDREADGTFDILWNSGSYRLTRISPSGGQTTTLAAGISRPRGMVRAADGNYYVSNRGDNSISKLTPEGLLTPFVTTGLNSPTGITMDGAGNFYVANSGLNNIIKVTPAGQTSIYATGLVGPTEVALDAQGNLYVTNINDSTVAKIPPGGGAAQVWARSVVSAPQGMQYDPAGNLYVAGNSGQLVKLDPADNVSVLYSGLSSPRAVAVGPSGDIFVAEASGRLTKHSNGVTSTFASGTNALYGLAFIGSTLYVTEAAASNRILAFDPSGQRTTVSESIGVNLQDLHIAPNGDRYVLSGDLISRVPVANTPVEILARGGFSGTSFAPANDGGFFVQEGSAIRRVSPTGTVTVFKSGLAFLTWGIVADAANNLLVAESSSRKILRIAADGTVTELATTTNFINSIADDGAGGLFLAFSTGHLGRVSSTGVVTILTTTIVGFVSRLAYDAAAGKLYLLDSSGIRSFDIATRAVATILTRSSLNSIRLAGGKLYVTNNSTSELLEVSLQGAVTPVTVGYNFPSPIVTDGTRLYFTDVSRTVSLVPGQLPKLVLPSGNVRHLAWRNGKLYGTFGSQVYTLTPGGAAWSPLLTTGSSLQGIAFRGDGAFTVGSDTDSRFTTFDAGLQVIASYAGIGAPSGIVVDASGFVYVGSTSSAQIVKIAPSGKQSSVFATGVAGANSLTFDAAGQLHALASNAVVRLSATGQVTTLGTAPNNALYGLSVSASGILAVEDFGSLVRKLSGNQMLPFVAGLSSPLRVAADGQGGVYVANNQNGTVTRIANGVVTTKAVGLTNPNSLAVAPGGELLVGGSSGHLYKIDAAGVTTQISNLSALFGTSINISWLTLDASGVLNTVFSGRNEVRRLVYHPATPPPAAGTLVYSTTRTFGGLGVDGVPTPVDFGTWLPPYGGDFAFSVIPAGGLQGGAANTLHVGPHATGEIVTAKASVPPGNSPLGVSVNVDGADFTTLAKVDAANVSLAVATGVSARGMGADAAGNVFVTIGDANLLKFSPSGVKTTLYSLPSPQSIAMRGGVPVDDLQNVYISGGATNRDVIRVAPNGTATVLATLAETIVSLARARNDVIYALTNTKLWRIDRTGAITLATPNTFTSPFAVTVDGQDNVYIQLYGNYINKVKADGTVVNVLAPDTSNIPGFEYEGMNMAGDCADNLFVTPFTWPAVGQTAGEEYTLVQLVGRTGRAAQILDGRTLNPQMFDLDFIVYDRFSGSLLMWSDTNGSRLFRIPVTCGAISSDLHLVFPAAQPAAGFSVAPKAVITRADGSKEYVWTLKDVTSLGKSVSFTTTLQNLKLGDIAPVVSEAFLVFQNTFIAGDITLPLQVPTVGVDGMVDVGVATDQSQYDANTDVLAVVSLANRDATTSKSGLLLVEVVDPQDARLTVATQQSVSIAPGATLPVNPPFNTGTYLTGAYLMQATLTDAASGVVMATGSAGFSIVAPGVTLVSSVTTDKTAYEAFDAVNIVGRVRNASFNAIANSLTVQVSVKDPSGQPMFSGSGSVPVLVPQAFKDSTFLLRLSSAPSGSYSVEEKLVDAAGSVVETRTTTFTVMSSADTGSGLRGAVAATRLANRGDPVAITVTVSNQGNAALSGVPVTIKVVNPASGALVQQWTSSVNLGQGAQQQVVQAWDTSSAEAGTYVAAASAAFGGRDIALGQATISVGVIQPFSFASFTNAPLYTVVESGSVAIGGIVAPAQVSITEGEFRVGAGAWSGSTGIVNPGDLLTVRVTTPGTFNATTTAALTVAGFTATFSVTTLNPDTTPDPFGFAPQVNVPLASLRTSNTVTITGIDVAVPVSIALGEYSINGGPWVSVPGTIANGDTVAVRLTAAGTLGTTTVATLTVSGVSGAFSVTTTAEDRTPDAFAFAPQNDVPLNSLRTSNTITLTGINVAVPIQVTGGEYSVNGGAFTSAPGTVSSGNTIAVRQTSSGEFSKTTTATVTVSGVSASFAVSTEGEDRVPDAIEFAPQTDVPLHDVRTSNAVTIRGINTTVPIQVAGGEYRVNSAGFTAAPGTVAANDVVTVRQTSSSSFAATTTATLTVSGVAAPFAVTTKIVADVTTTPALPGDGRVLVLVSCKSGGNDDGDDDSSCVQQRVAFLDSYLTGLAIEHAIVTDNDRFKAELRSGRYNTYWISGGAKKLKDDLAEELRAAAFRGETLVVDGVHDNRNHDIDDVLGVKYKGKPSSLTTVTLSGAFLPAGTFTVSGTKAIRVELTTGLRQARFSTGDPALVTNDYGYGKGLLFAFDLTGTLLAQSASALLRDMLDHSLDFVAPTVPLAFTGGAYVPLTIVLHNAEPVAVDLDVTASLPAGFSLAAGAPPATVSGSDVRWITQVPAGGSVSLAWAVRTPQASGSYSIPVVVKQVYGSIPVLVGSYPIAVTIAGLDTGLARVIADLQALVISNSKDRGSRDDALASLRTVQGHIDAARWESAVEALVQADEELESVTSVNVKTHRAAVASVLKEVERRWWSALPACPATPPCRN